MSPRVARSALLGRAAGDASLAMSFTLRLQHPAEVDALLAEQQRPGSVYYHRWLTPAEVAARFGPAPQDYAALVGWLRDRGFAVTTWPNRLRIDFVGTVRKTEGAFGVHMNRYSHRSREALANADTAVLPARFAALVQSARLNTFALARPLVRIVDAGMLVTTMAPDDLYAAYDMKPVFADGIDGTGETIAVIERSDFQSSDVSAFQSQFGVVPARVPNKVFPAGNPGVGSPNFACAGMRRQQLQSCLLGEETEVVLDTEWAAAAAPGASVLVDISNADVDLSLADVVNHHPEAKIIALSFGSCERLDAASQPIFEPLYTQAALQGQTVLVASGDNGPDECGDGGPASVNVLASDANVTAVGGTRLDPGFDAGGVATGYVSEAAWNDQAGASGGGASKLVPKPSYQSGPGVPADGSRDLPDVALLASPQSSGYVMLVEQQISVVGGTSVGAPAWAGIVALLNQAAGGAGLGAVNYALYDLGRRQHLEGGAAVFHDVTAGNTTFDHVAGFAAGAGFDLATGWGSPDVSLLRQALASGEPPSPTGTATSTPTPTATRTPTPVSSATPSRLPTTTRTPVSGRGCVGDCAASGVVTAADLMQGVHIVLGAVPESACPAFDCNGNGRVTVDCLSAAVDAALNGCSGTE